jgi:hypothetical protein
MARIISDPGHCGDVRYREMTRDLAGEASRRSIEGCQHADFDRNLDLVRKRADLSSGIVTQHCVAKSHIIADDPCDRQVVGLLSGLPPVGGSKPLSWPQPCKCRGQGLEHRGHEITSL